MKPHVKTAAVSALKWAALLSAGLILGPMLMAVVVGGSSAGRLGELFAQKLVVGIFWFPILFIGIWVASSSAMRVATKDTSLTGGSTDTSASPSPPTAPIVVVQTVSKWTYVWLGVGIFMLLFLFLPEIISGTLARQYFLGVVFWLGVIIYCGKKIIRGRATASKP